MKKTKIQPSPRQERIFFGSIACWFLVVNFVGFAPSFYLRQSPEPLPLNELIHGLVYSAWILLYAAQSALVSTKRIRLHMALGAGSVALLLLMIPVGFNVVLAKVATGLKTVSGAGFNIVSLALAFGFAFAGLAYREHPFVHKRLMLFATLMLTIAAADRVAFILGLEDVRLYRKLLSVVPGLAVVVFDAVLHRKLPVLSLSLLAATWLTLWFIVSGLIFNQPIGETVISWLIGVFVW